MPDKRSKDKGRNKKDKKSKKSKNFKQGDFLWIKDKELLYTPGQVLKTFPKGSSGTVELIETGKKITITAKDSERVAKCDKKTVKENSSDLTKLKKLTEYSILYSLRKRFAMDQIYTYIGGILVSVNPFKEISIYGPDVTRSFLNGSMKGTPHVYGIADRAYRQMVSSGLDQCVIVTGESGAGKTEAVKLILQYLTEKSSVDASMKETSEALQGRILEMNPLLEAFGNAKTGRNNNSSRFGKLTQLFFDSTKGNIIGVGVVDYLLEKTRIVQQSDSERNYHIFYQMLTGYQTTSADLAGSKILDIIAETGSYPESFYYLSQKGLPEQVVSKAINDKKDWGATFKSMMELGMSTQEINDVLVSLMGVLLIGNIKFLSTDAGDENSKAKIQNPEVLQKICDIFGFDKEALSNGLLTTEISTSIDTVYRDHTYQMAIDARDALAKQVYAKLFALMVFNVNNSLEINRSTMKKFYTMNILDIFGFESFLVNSFEQMCINYCNEKLQVHFVDNVIKLEQLEYEKEGIEVKKVEFVDTSNVLEVLEGNNGVYALLDEQNKLPKGSDEMFLKKVLQLNDNKTYASVVKYPNVNLVRKNPILALNFNIAHFAGEVSYNVKRFLEKNSDKLLVSLEKVVNGSTNPFVGKLWDLEAGGMTSMNGANYNHNKKFSSRVSLGYKFRRQLEDLMTVLNTSEPQFVRTIKPNDEKVSKKYQSDKVLDQIKYAGLLSVCEIHKNGFPIKLEFEPFKKKYAVLVKNSTYLSPLEILNILSKEENTPVPRKDWKVGKTKVFMRNAAYEGLETLREERLYDYAVAIQKRVRGFLTKVRFVKVNEMIGKMDDAIEAQNVGLLEDLIKESKFLPKIGKFLEILTDAKQTLVELKEQEETVKLLKQALKKEDTEGVKDILNDLQVINIQEGRTNYLRNNSVVFEAQTFLKEEGQDELPGVGLTRSIQRAFENEDYDTVMRLIWEKMSGAFGVSEADVNIIAQVLDSLEREQGGRGEKSSELRKAERLLDFAKLQFQGQELISNAIESRITADLLDAYNLSVQLGLNTNDAKRVKQLLRNKNEKRQLNFSVRLSEAQAQNINQMAMAMGGEARPTTERNGSFGGNPMSANFSAKMQTFNGGRSTVGGGMNGLTGPKSNRLSAMVDMSSRLQMTSAKMSARFSSALAGKMNNDNLTMLGSMQGMDQMNNFDIESFAYIREPEDFFDNTTSDTPILNYTGKLLPKSITQLVPQINELAIQINRSILQYCGDIPAQFVNASASFVLQQATSDSILHDEVYLQLVKQTRFNTRATSEDRAWTLMILATQLFPPSRELEPYLFAYLSSMRSIPLLIGNYARLCIVQLDRTIEIGVAGEYPDPDQIADYLARPAVFLSLDRNLLGTYASETLDIPVYPDVDVEMVVQSACSFLSLENPELYGLFVVGQPIASESPLALRLRNFYQKWDKSKLKHVEYFASSWKNREDELFRELVKKYGPEPAFDLSKAMQDKDNLTSRIQSVGSQRSRISNASAGSVNAAESELSYPIPWWTFPGDVYMNVAFKGREPVFSLRRKLIFPEDAPTQQLVLQMIPMISSGELPIKEYENICMIAAIAMIMKNGGTPRNMTQLMSLGLDYILPKIWLQAQEVRLTADYILTLANSPELSNLRPRDMYAKFIETAKLADGYGNWFYPMRNVSFSNDSRRSVAYDAAYVGVSAEGVGLFDVTRTERLYLFTYNTISEYKAVTGEFSLFFDQAQMLDQFGSVTIDTDLAWEIYAIVFDYVKVGAKRRGKKGRTDAFQSFDRQSVMRTRAF